MSPIGNILLMNCCPKMTVDLEEVKKQLPEVKECFIRKIAKMLGVSFRGDP